MIDDDNGLLCTMCEQPLPEGDTSEVCGHCQELLWKFGPVGPAHENNKEWSR